MLDFDSGITTTASLQSPNVLETSTRPALVIFAVNAKIRHQTYFTDIYVTLFFGMTVP